MPNYGQFCEKHKGDQMDICRLIHDYAEKAYDMGYEEGARNGREEAWKCAKQISDMTMEKCEEVFGEYRYFGTVVENFTAAGALARLEGYKAKHTDKSCDSCKFEDKAIGEEPCKNCKHSYMDEWQAKR